MQEMAISEITIGERYRRDMGDLEGLMDSIEDLGLLHPVVVTPGGVLVAGMRRLEACKRLAMKTVPVRVVDTDRLVQAEHDENELRKSFLPSERVAIGRALEPGEKQAAKERQGTRTDKHPEKFTGSSGGRAEDKAAEAVGWSRPTYQKAKEVVEAAEEEPDAYGDLQREMDRSGKVDPAHRKLTELKRKKEAEKEAESTQAIPEADDTEDAGGPPPRLEGQTYVEEARAVDHVLAELERLRGRLERIGRKYGLGAASVERIEAALGEFNTILKTHGSET